MKTTVRQVLRDKGSEILAIKPDASILDALKLMEEKNIGAVLIMDGDKVKGIFSERDHARKGILKGIKAGESVTKVMTSSVYYVSPDQTMQECSAFMTDKRIRHLPVVENGKVIGVISIGDVVKSIMSDQEVLIHGLENYIMGSGYNL